MQTIKKELEAIRASREEVQEEMKKCRDRFMQQMAAIAKPRKSTIYYVTELAVSFNNLKGCLT